MQDWFRRLWNAFWNRPARARRRRSRAGQAGFEHLQNRVLPTASVIVTPDADFFTTENGTETHFSVVLSEALTKDKKHVKIGITSSDTTEGTVSTRWLEFTGTNWNVPQTVTITGVDDSQFDGDKTYTIELSKLKTNSKNYKRLDPDDLQLVNKDNEVVLPNIVMSPASSNTVNEGASSELSFHLKTQPTADVHVVLEVTAGEGQATLSTNTLTFTPENWDVDQHVTITGATGDGQDGDQSFKFTVSATSDDADYNSLPAKTVSVKIHDIDVPNIPLDGDYTGTYSGNIRLLGISSPVSGDVAFSVLDNILTVTAPTTGAGTISGATGSFSPTSGQLAGSEFTGTFIAHPDGSITASGTWSVSLAIGSGTGTWTAYRPPAGVTLPGITVAPATGFTVNEGAHQDVAVSLQSQPTADVVVSFAVTVGAGQATLSTTTLTFTSENWDTPQHVTINGVADETVDGDKPFVVTVQASSEDVDYDGLTAPTIATTIHDLDVDVTPPTLDGNYVGSYVGAISFLGSVTPVNEQLAFNITGNTVTLTNPPVGSGTIENFSGTFTLPDNAGTFTGQFVANPDGSETGSGTWFVSNGLITGSGTWTATRPPVNNA